MYRTLKLFRSILVGAMLIIPSFVSATTFINIYGTVTQGTDNAPVCAMVLANGKHMFSCDGTGRYTLTIPLDAQGNYKLQVYADGYLPNVNTYSGAVLSKRVYMDRPLDCSVSIPNIRGVTKGWSFSEPITAIGWETTVRTDTTLIIDTKRSRWLDGMKYTPTDTAFSDYEVWLSTSYTPEHYNAAGDLVAANGTWARIANGTLSGDQTSYQIDFLIPNKVRWIKIVTPNGARGLGLGELTITESLEDIVIIGGGVG